jgi:hypothetical protein
MSGTWLYGGVQPRRKSSGKSSGKSSPEPGQRRESLRARHSRKARALRAHCRQTPGIAKKPSCRRLAHEQVKRRAFMSKSKRNRDAHQHVTAIRSGGRLSRKDLKRVKGGRYFLATKPKVSAGFLAWQAAVKQARPDYKGVVLPREGGAFYNAAKENHAAILSDKQVMASLEAKAREKNRVVEEHNAALHRRTASNSGRTTAKFLAWRNAVKGARRGDPARFGKIVPKKEGTADQQEFYRAAVHLYRVMKGKESGWSALEDEAKKMDAKRARKHSVAGSVVARQDDDDIYAQVAEPVRKSHKSSGKKARRSRKLKLTLSDKK